MWIQFWDMHSGGGQKEKWAFIYIEAPRKEAEVIFYNRFRHNPNRVTCTCCGGDYSIDEGESLEQLSGYHRNCTIEEYSKQKDVLIIRSNDVGEADFEVTEIPEQDYVWKGE